MRRCIREKKREKHSLLTPLASKSFRYASILVHLWAAHRPLPMPESVSTSSACFCHPADETGNQGDGQIRYSRKDPPHSESDGLRGHTGTETQERHGEERRKKICRTMRLGRTPMSIHFHSIEIHVLPWLRFSPSSCLGRTSQIAVFVHHGQ